MKYCHQCGAGLDESARFCTACGAPVAQPPVQPQSGRAPIPPPPPGYRQILGQEGAPPPDQPPGQSPAPADIDYEAAFKFATKTDG